MALANTAAWTVAMGSSSRNARFRILHNSDPSCFFALVPDMYSASTKIVKSGDINCDIIRPRPVSVIMHNPSNGGTRNMYQQLTQVLSGCPNISFFVLFGLNDFFQE